MNYDVYEDRLYQKIEKDFDRTIQNCHQKIKQIEAVIESLTNQREQTLRVYREHTRDEPRKGDD